MSKAVLISIRQEWCEKIISGEKTIEVRKTRPKMDTPFKCYIYKCGNGKVIGEFLCDQIININGAGRIPSDVARPTCLEPAELHQYLGAATGFGWHISNLRIYDTPRELREFYAVPNEVEVALKAKHKPITRPPQSWRYVEEQTCMKRLTFEGNFCDIAQCRDLACQQSGTCTQGLVWERLKAYEDTGLEPEAVETVKLALAAKHMVDLETLNNTPISRLVELAKADKDGRVLILPCKVGDPVWRIVRDGEPHITRDEVRDMCFADDMTLCVELVGGRVTFTEKFGKTVFLSREEAEKALQEMEGKKDG